MLIVRLTINRERPASRVSADGVPARANSALLANVDAVKAERDRIVAALPGMGLTSVPSDATFVLFGRFADAHAAWQALLDRDVLVRDVGIPGWLRVTAGTPEETDAFLTALGEVARAHCLGD